MEKIEEARGKVASLIGANPEEIIFTSCGTESNNLAIKGIAQSYKNKGNHIITSSIEHLSIIHPLKTLKKNGFEITELKVSPEGKVNPDDVRKSIKRETILITIQHSNPEIGTIQEIEEIGKIAKENEILFHTDAVSSCGIVELDVNKLNVDLLSFSAQNFYGPKGIAGLFIRKGVKIPPQLEGGIQERGIRSGLENVPGIIGMGKAAEIAKKNLKNWQKKFLRLRDKILDELPKRIEHVIITGSREKRLPNHASFCIKYIEGEAMILSLDMEGIFVTSGSACTSKALKASHVLLSCGIDHATAQGSIVFSFGIENNEEDLKKLFEVFPPIVKRLRDMSPLYAKFLKEGKDVQ